MPRPRGSNYILRPDAQPGTDGGSLLQHATQPFLLRKYVAGSVAAYACTFFVTNPSARLKCSIETYFDFDPSQVAVSSFVSGSNYYAIRGFANAEQVGKAYLHTIIDGVADTRGDLPGSYELDSGLKLVRYFASLVPPRDVGANNLYGKWMSRVLWEPNIGGMEKAEFDHLIARCSASAPVNAANIVL